MTNTEYKIYLKVKRELLAEDARYFIVVTIDRNYVA